MGKTKGGASEEEVRNQESQLVHGSLTCLGDKYRRATYSREADLKVRLELHFWAPSDCTDCFKCQGRDESTKGWGTEEST